MKIIILNTGRTTESYLREGLEHYEKRIRHYIPFEMVYLPPPRLSKAHSEKMQREEEGRIIIGKLEQADYRVLLDERGIQLTSEGFSNFLQQAMNRGTRTLGFIIGGPFGFSEEVYSAVPERISLSGMTFPHQLIRLFLLEQIYRGFTIIRRESYHHG